MAKINRFLQTVFGSTAGGNQVGKFGSLAAGAPAYSTDPAVIQSLSNFAQGWLGAVLGNNSPAIEDMNGLHLVQTSGLKYLNQMGVSEWISTESYYIGSIVNSGGILYVSKTDNNLGNALTDSVNWAYYINKRLYVDKTTSYTATDLDDIIHADSTLADVVITLPTAVGRAGKVFTIKATVIGTFGVTVNTTSSQLIDASISFVYTVPYESHSFLSDNSNWLVL
jgi:hypothetical protein